VGAPPRRFALLALELAVALAAAGAIAWALSAARSGGEAPPTTPEATVDLEGVDTFEAASITELAAGSDCVVTGEVVDTERGRLVGAADSALVSKLVTIAVGDSLGCASTEIREMVVEEEGWLPNGTAVTVNGWPATKVGDRGVWFLVWNPSEDAPYAVTVSSAGSLRWRDGDALLPGDAPTWVREAMADGPEAAFRAARAGAGE
jgi:hypothetical protein